MKLKIFSSFRFYAQILIRQDGQFSTYLSSGLQSEDSVFNTVSGIKLNKGWANSHALVLLSYSFLIPTQHNTQANHNYSAFILLPRSTRILRMAHGCLGL